MVNELTIKNYKCFSNETSIKMSNITAALGVNSVGKSSLIQSLLLIKSVFDEIQYNTQNEKIDISVGLNDRYGLQLGDVNQLISANGEKEIIFSCDDIKLSFQECENKLRMQVNSNVSKETISQNKLYKNKLYYLNAERVGPRNHEMAPSILVDHCGFHGEYTFEFVNRNTSLMIDNRKKYSLEEKITTTFEKQLEYWMQYIVEGVEIKFEPNIDLRLSQMKIKQQALDTAFNSPYNYGFGISYILPIVATCLVAEEGSIVIVENPEAHLHPKGQSNMGKFLAKMSQAGLQLIIETHSEHVINGIRVYACEHKIPPEEIAINFFSIENEQHMVKNIKLNENMDITEWPVGFMDQEENDLRELRILRRNTNENSGNCK